MHIKEVPNSRSHLKVSLVQLKVSRKSRPFKMTLVTFGVFSTISVTRMKSSAFIKDEKICYV